MYIDNKIESVWRIALEEAADDVDESDQVGEFLDMIIEEVDALHFLMLRLPLECGEHFWLAYRERVEEELAVVLGMERVYWALRGGFGGMPRRRDFSCAHRFKNLPLTALEDTQRRWDAFCETLREACEELKSAVKSSRSEGSSSNGDGTSDSSNSDGLGSTTSLSSASIEFAVSALDLNQDAEEVSFPNDDDAIPLNTPPSVTAGMRWFNVRTAEDEIPAPAGNVAFFISPEDLDFLKAVIPLLKLTHTIFKKIRLRFLNAECPATSPSTRKHSPRRLALDDLLDAAGPVPQTIEHVKSALLQPPYNHAFICRSLAQVVEDTERLIELVKEFLLDGEQAKWFDLGQKQLEAFLRPLNEMNPFR